MTDREIRMLNEIMRFIREELLEKLEEIARDIKELKAAAGIGDEIGTNRQLKVLDGGKE